MPNCCSPSSSEVSFGSQCWGCSGTRAHHAGVHCGSPAVSCVAARKVVPSPASHRSSVQLRRHAGPAWETQSCLFPQRPPEEKSYTHRAYGGAHFPRGRGAGSFQRTPSGHERRGPQCRPATHRGLGSRPPLLWWSSACCGCPPCGPPCAAQESHTQTPQTSTGAVLQQARRDKETTYPELVRSGRCRLVVLAMETGGRWSEDTVSVIHQLAIARAWEVPSYMSHQVALAWERTLDSHARHHMRNLIRRFVGGALLAL